MASFIDHTPITARAGCGGNGCVSFHREKFVQNGGPDGGDGGNGGDIVLYADPNLHTLLDFRYQSKYAAENGADGSANRCVGKSGERLMIKLPPGTVVKERDTGRVVADMFTAGEYKTLLRGGRGGWGNAHFATPTRQAPNFAKPGVKTETHEFLLELKTIADVGLVGFPNVGKSTLLSVVSAARPKIANYHFTTLRPNLGMVRHKGQDFVMADIPGLIEGAADGAGLGHDFLRHVDRTRLLVHVVDISGSEGRDPIEDYSAIQNELSRYGDLASRPQIVCANKTDIGGEEHLARLKELLKDTGTPVYAVSAATQTGVDALLDGLVKTLSTLPPLAPYQAEEAEPDAAPLSGYTVRKENTVYIVDGPSIEHLVDSVNFNDEESMNWFHRTLRKSGVIDALRNAGAQEGDTVELAGMQFDFIE